MQTVNRKRSVEALLACLIIALGSGLLGCQSAPQAPLAATAPATAVATPEPTVTPEPTLPATPLPAPTAATAPATPAVGPSPAPLAESLVSLREDSVLLGDSWGGNAHEVLSLGPVSSLAFWGTQLAYVANGSLMVANLRGGAPQRVADVPPAFLLGPDLAWTADGRALLTIADRQDAQAAHTGRSIDIGVVPLPGGPWHPGLALADRAGVTILQADNPTGQVLLVAWEAEPSFHEAQRYDLTSGQLVGTLPIAGEDEILPSPDRRLALTTLFDAAKGVDASLIYDLSQDSAPVRFRLEHPSQTHAASQAWSPDGKRVAYLLRDGATPLEAGDGARGIWVWDLERQQTTQVAEAADPSAGPVAWTPDGRYLICRQVDAAGGATFYAVPADGGPASPLPLDPSSRLLGWMPVSP